VITKGDIEIERTPNELRQFVTTIKSKIDNCKQERHRECLRKGSIKYLLMR
jgi:hypothetical protein